MMLRSEENCREAGRRLQVMMESKGVSCTRLAKAVCMDYVSIWNYIHGKHNPYTNNAVRICNYLGCRVNDIWKEDALVGSTTKHSTTTRADVQIANAGFVKDVEGSADDEIFYIKEDVLNHTYICVTMTKDDHGDWKCIHETYIDTTDEFIPSRMTAEEMRIFYNKLCELERGDDE